MNVMMIGHTSSGKTTYMAAMYKIMNAGIQGYSIETPNKSAHNNLQHLSASIKQGIYPKSTDILTEYKFNLHFTGKSLIEFNWHDYRGGALLQSTGSSPDVAELNRKIKESDAVIVFLDGDKMTESDSNNQQKVRRLLFCIQQAVNDVDQSSIFPVSLVVTKGKRFETINLFETPGFMAVKNLIDQINQNKNIQGLLTVTEINRIDILNVEFPFLFSMLFGIIKQQNETVKKYNECLERAKGNAANANVFDDVFCFFSGHRTYRDLAYEKLASLKVMNQNIEYLASNSANIKKILEDANQSRLYMF
jgi:hypothetical protein